MKDYLSTNRLEILQPLGESNENFREKLTFYEIDNREKSIGSSAFDFLRTSVSFVAVEVPEDAGMSEDDMRTAAGLAVLVSEEPRNPRIISMIGFQVEPTVRYAGQLEVKSPASLSPDIWRNDFGGLLLRAASIAPNTQVAVYEVNGDSSFGLLAKDALSDALHYLSQRPADSNPAA